MARFSMVSVASSPFVDDPEVAEAEAVAVAQTPSRQNKYRPINDIEMSELQERVYALEYEISRLDDLRQVDQVNHQQESRDLQKRLNDETARANAAEWDQKFLFDTTKSLQESLEKERSEISAQKSKLNHQIRVLETEQLNLEEELQITKEDLADFQSLYTKEVNNYKTQIQTYEKARQDHTTEMSSYLKELSKYRTENTAQQEEIFKLKAQLADATSKLEDSKGIEKLQKDSHEQLLKIAQLQSLADQQTAEIKSLKETEALVGVLQEERDSLAKKAAQTATLKDEIFSYQEQLLALQQEQDSWKAYLEKNPSLKSPEQIVKELMEQRVENINLLQRVGRLEAELASETNNDTLESADLEKLKALLQETETKLKKESDHRARLEKLKELASSEINILQSQVQDYEQELRAGTKEDNSADKFKQLEELVEKYRRESQDLAERLSQKEGLVNTLSSPVRRLRESDGSATGERLSEALRKNRNLQVEVEKSNGKVQMMEKEIEVLRKQNSNIRANLEKPAGRILQLRDNPTSKYEAIKKSMLDALKQENESLHAELANRPIVNDKLVPSSALERIRLENHEIERAQKEQVKRTERLKEVFTKKSLEFRESVYALLGYQIDLLPNKKINVKSAISDKVFTFLPDSRAKNKFVGLEEGDFTPEIENLITFWVKERGEIPCFLAALYLEMYDKK